MSRSTYIGDATPRDAYAQAVEADFNTMKQLATIANYPSDLKARIIQLDQMWQKAKETANERKISAAHEAGPIQDGITQMITELRSRINQVATTPLSQPALIPSPTPNPSPSSGMNYTRLGLILGGSIAGLLLYLKLRK